MFLKRMKNLLLLIFTVSMVFLCSCRKTRTPVSYELPNGYSGWVTIRFEKPGAPPLEFADGRYKIKISENGFAETSSGIEDGWAEDRYYWINDGEEHILPQYMTGNKSMIHSETFKNAGYTSFVNPDTVPLGKEINLYDGSSFTKLDDNGGLSYKSGRYLLYIFYVSAEPEDMWDFSNNSLPPIPPEHQMW